MRQITLMLSLLIFVSLANAQTIDKESSIVNFSIGNMKWRTVEGSFKGMQGKIVFDKTDLQVSSFKVSIDPATVNTENKTRDGHLKNEDFFNVEKFRTISFTSDKIWKEGDNFITKGKMTMHGVTQEVSIPFRVNENGNKMTFTGEIELNRFDYGLGAEKYDGTFMVGELVKIKINCVLIK